MPKDLRTYLHDVATIFPDEIRVFPDEVDPKFEITAYVEKLETKSEDPVAFFKKVKGSKLPTVANAMATYKRLSHSLDTNEKDMVEEYARRESRPIPMKTVEKSRAPVKEVVLKGSEAKLSLLPLLYHNELDGGKYIDSAVMQVKDPDNGWVNCGIYRHQIWDDGHFGIMTNPNNHANYVWRKYRDLGKPMEVALVVGHHPAYYMAAVARLPQIGGELDVAGGLMGEALEVVNAETLDMVVPARAEVVIEGVVKDPTKLVDEGPFGEWPRYYSGKKMVPVAEVTAITMRKDAIYQDIIAAHNEHTILGALPRMGSILRRVKGVVPSAIAVNLPVSGAARCHCYISMKKFVDGEPKQAAFAAFATDPNIKMVVVVDEDIDVFNEQEVLWAIATRFQADIGLSIIPHALGGHLNPSAYALDRTKHGVMETKLILDATIPMPPFEFAPRAMAPRAVFEKVNAEKVARNSAEELISLLSTKEQLVEVKE
jgi:2,5-furandicarboxylate decarboxylase 1